MQVHRSAQRWSLSTPLPFRSWDCHRSSSSPFAPSCIGSRHMRRSDFESRGRRSTILWCPVRGRSYIICSHRQSFTFFWCFQSSQRVGIRWRGVGNIRIMPGSIISIRTAEYRSLLTPARHLQRISTLIRQQPQLVAGAPTIARRKRDKHLSVLVHHRWSLVDRAADDLPGVGGFGKEVGCPDARRRVHLGNVERLFATWGEARPHEVVALRET